MCQNSEKSDDKTTLKQFPRITERFQSSREADLLLQKFQNKDFFHASKFIQYWTGTNSKIALENDGQVYVFDIVFICSVEFCSGGFSYFNCTIAVPYILKKCCEKLGIY